MAPMPALEASQSQPSNGAVRPRGVPKHRGAPLVLEAKGHDMNTKHIFKIILVIPFATVLSPAWCLWATDASSLVRSTTAATSGAASGTVTPSSLVMIENRARVLGNQTSASGTRYFAVTDSDLVGKTPDQIIHLLSPTAISTADGVRTMEIVVDLKRPLTLYNSTGEQINIGTAIVQGSPSFRQIEVHSSILASDLTVIDKKQ